MSGKEVLIVGIGGDERSNESTNRSEVVSSRGQEGMHHFGNDGIGSGHSS